MERVRILIALIALFFSVTFASAQQTAAVGAVPNLINYSGVLKDGSGKVLTSITGVTFLIYSQQQGGAPVWMETQNVQPDARGNYTAQLGSTKPDGMPVDLFTTGEARWLALTVNGGEEQPRVLLVAVPYAMKAADAQTLGGLPASAFVRANKPAAPGVNAAASSGKSTTPPTNPAVTGSGVVDFIPMWDTANDIVDSIIFQKGSQIGIGTASPAAKLDVHGKGDVRDTLTLFPKGTDPTLAINGTTFKVDQTGKMTFVSGQTFPGTGTATSVGLSAPSTDFTVTGSPVTTGGTLGLNWNVAPTNADTANAIVKRDSTGSFTANTITAGVVNATSLGANGASSVGVIIGTNSGTSSTSDGVHGATTSGTASGVAGINAGSGKGVFGSGGVGVFGTGTAFGMQTDSNVQQARTAGGWVKATFFFSPLNGGGFENCYNSTLSGAAATTPPCGFTIIDNFHGDYILDLGFQVDDRPLSATGGNVSGFVAACTDLEGFCQNPASLTPNRVELTNTVATNCGGSGCEYFFFDNKIYLIVY